jgi:hypothetical protein
MGRKAKWARVFFVAALFLASSGLSTGQSVGIRAGLYTDLKEYFLGGELLSRISHNLYFNPNVEYVFVDRGTYMTFNLDFHYDFYTSSPLFFWLGAGLGILYDNPEGPADSNTDLGANLLFGLGIRTESSLTPYVQSKFILADGDEFVIAIGLRF